MFKDVESFKKLKGEGLENEDDDEYDKIKRIVEEVGVDDERMADAELDIKKI